MSDLIRAYPWLQRLHPLRHVVLPLIGTVLFVASSLSVAGEGPLAILAMLLCATGLALAWAQPWLAVVCSTVGTTMALFAHADNGYAWVLTVSPATVALLAAQPRSPIRWLALGLAGGVGLAMGYAVPWLGFLLPPTLLIGSWAIGFAIGQAVARVQAVARNEVLVERLDASELELTLTAERERVAQEVHDVVAHSLAVILAQAQGARALSRKRPSAMADALDRIADASRSALLDVRGIVDGLTGGDDPPQPTVDDLPALLRGVEDAGIAVRTTSAGEPRGIGATQELAVYRIVQEGATNAIRHRGRGSALDVVLDWRGPGLSIQVVSSGTGDAAPASGAGRGIPGMTERARVAGGWLAAGEDETGDHRISAFIPYRGAEIPVPA